MHNTFLGEKLQTVLYYGYVNVGGGYTHLNICVFTRDLGKN